MSSAQALLAPLETAALLQMLLVPPSTRAVRRPVLWQSFARGKRSGNGRYGDGASDGRGDTGRWAAAVMVGRSAFRWPRQPMAMRWRTRPADLATEQGFFGRFGATHACAL